MYTSYDEYVRIITQRPQLIKTLRNYQSTELRCALLTLPSPVFKNVWVNRIRAQGFYGGVGTIWREMRGFLENVEGGVSSGRLQEIHASVMRQILPSLLMLELNALNVQQVRSRLEKIKTEWKLDVKVCGGVIAWCELNQSKEGENEHKIQKILSNMLALFGCCQSEVDYRHWGMDMLRQAVGEMLYELRMKVLDVDDLYHNFISSNKKNVVYLLEKLKTRRITFGAIISELTLLDNNLTSQSKLMNICIFFLLVEYWHRMKGELKETTIIYVISEAFHRFMYMLYGCEDKLCETFLYMLGECGFNKFQEITTKVAYQLIALHKIYKMNEKTILALAIEAIWKDKFGEVKLDNMYIEYCPSFISESQKGGKIALEDNNNKLIGIISSMALLKESQKGTQKEKGIGSKRKTETRTANFNNWIKAIQTELKKFNIERVFLLLEGLRKFYSVEYKEVDNPPNENILRLIVTIIKKVEQKIKYRYNCSLLGSVINWQLSHLISLCYTKQFNYEQPMVGLGLFELCSVEGGYMSLDEIIKLHEQYNFEETLETILNIKCLEQSMVGNKFSDKIQKFEEMLIQNSIEGKLYRLFRADFPQDRDRKKLAIIARLLSLKSTNITNNLLVNYVYYLLQQETHTDPKLELKLNAFSKFMNQEIGVGSDWQKMKLLLRMGTVFDDFDKKRKDRPNVMTTAASLSERYFRFLMRKEHKDYFLIYSQRYERLNYLKQAIFFLELHCYSYPAENHEPLKRMAVDLYQRISSCFSKSLSFNAKYLKLEIEQQQNVWANEFYKLQTLIEKGLRNIELKWTKSAGETLIEGMSTFPIWIKYYHHVVSFSIDYICELKESDEIRQNLFIYNIMVMVLSIKMAQCAGSGELNFKVMDLVKKIEELKNQTIQLILYRILIEDLQILKQQQTVEYFYLQKLLKSNKSDELMQYLIQRRKDKSFERDEDYNKKYMRYIIRDNFQNARYIDAMAFIKEYLQFKDIQNRSEIYQLELECKYNVQLNFSLSDYLEFLSKKCITPLQSKDNKEKHFSFYFKIFRMLFQRYSFTKQEHNNSFLEVYYRFVETNKILTDHREKISETIFYLLRFVVERFYYGQDGHSYGLGILEYFRGYSKQFVPYCTYLLKRISGNNQRNALIETILVYVIVQNSRECIWIISFLKNFQMVNSKSKPVPLQPEEEQEARVIRFLYRKVMEELQSKKNVTKQYHSHLMYLQSLTRFALMETNQKNATAEAFRKMDIPPELPFVFFQNFFIHKIQQVKVLGNGKSNPLQISLVLRNEKCPDFKYLRIIIKSIAVKNYRMESNTANFFSESGLIDQDATYRIFHLSKSVVLIQHVSNSGTINGLIKNYFPMLKVVEDKAMKEFNKVREGQKKALQLYDELKWETRAGLSEIIRFKCRNMSEWWTKYTNFVRTHAQWSFIGYVVGLGDRHFDNILMAENCKLIHIDFQYALDIGYKLPYPEWTPFRLTNSLIQPLGLLGVFGLYYAQMIRVGRQFQSREQGVWRAISNFVDFSQTNLTQEMLNRARFVNYRINVLEEGIAHVITCAKRDELLRLMYIGWRPYY